MFGRQLSVLEAAFFRCSHSPKHIQCKANSADEKLMIFSYFSPKIGFDITCKLSPEETVCIKCQIIFSGINKKKKNLNVIC